MAYKMLTDEDFVHLSRLILEGKLDDSVALIRRTLRDIQKNNPDLSPKITELFKKTNSSVIRKLPAFSSIPMPVDLDTRLELLKKENLSDLPINLQWESNIQDQLNRVIKERSREDELAAEGISLIKSLLFVGPPGVGKTAAAKWLAHNLGIPLFTLDLAAVMSSYLGKTGNNIRAVLEFAKKQPCILLLDEFDAIAKKRNDDSEVGELKRLVTVLLQEIDEWPEGSLLIAATNHPELLDPAIWRRFEGVMNFPYPDRNEVKNIFLTSFENYREPIDKEMLELLSELFVKSNFSEVERTIKNLKRISLLDNIPVMDSVEKMIAEKINNLEKKQKSDLASNLLRAGFSQRKVSDLTGLSRDTLRKHLNQ